MSLRRLVMAVLVPAAALTASTACDDTTVEPEVGDIDLMRQSTEVYRSVDAALAGGFVPLSECVAGPTGGMGFHYGHPGRIGDAVIDPELPEILLYAPNASGGLELVGVEFMIHQDAWPGPGAPTVADTPFDPPNPNHPDEMIRPFHTLHAWVWKDNPAGIFAPFNPSVQCD